MENKFIMSSSPHLHTSTTITKIMLDVIIALAPAAVLGVFFFGFYAAAVQRGFAGCCHKADGSGIR